MLPLQINVGNPRQVGLRLVYWWVAPRSKQVQGILGWWYYARYTGWTQPLQIRLGNLRLVVLRWYTGRLLPLQISLGYPKSAGLRWYTGRSLALQISLGKPGLMVLC